MATHDEERRPMRDRLHSARERYQETGSSMKWVGFVIGFALLALLVYLIFAAGNVTTTDDATRQTPTTTTAPRTTAPAPQAPTTPPTTQPK
jgi:hypothetical protein